MAIAQLGIVYTEVAGKMGNAVAVRTLGGNAIKGWVVPTNPRTAAQTNIRDLMAYTVQQWQAMTDEDRAAWQAVTSEFPYSDSFGNVRYYSGYTLFCKFGMKLEIIGAGLNTVAPTPEDYGGLRDWSFATASPSILKVDYGFAGDITHTGIIMEATAPLSSGIMSPNKSAYRYLGIITPTLFGSYIFTAEYSAIFGTPISGKKIFTRWQTVNYDNGQSSVYNWGGLVVS